MITCKKQLDDNYPYNNRDHDGGRLCGSEKHTAIKIIILGKKTTVHYQCQNKRCNHIVPVVETDSERITAAQESLAKYEGNA